MKRFVYVLIGLMTALCAVATDKKDVEVDGLTFEIIENRQVAALQKVSDDIVDLVVPETVTVDGVEYVVNEFAMKNYGETGVCQGYTNLKTLNTGAVKYISQYAFKGCTALESVVMPEVESLDEECFRDCISLVTIDAPKLDAMNGGVFRGCTALKDCVFPMLSYSKGGDFAECTALESVRFEDTHAFSVGSSMMIPPYDYPSFPGTFAGCTSLREVYFGSGITHAGEYILIPEQWVMYGLSEGLVKGLFDGCESLEKITVSRDLTYRTGSLKDLKSLKSLTLGVGCISHLYPDAVTGCDIREIHCMYPVPPELLNDYEPIEVDKETCVVYVPKGCRDRYMQSRYWGGFANIIEDETVEPAFDPALGPKSWVYRVNNEERTPLEDGGYTVRNDVYALYPTEHEGELAYALPCFQFSHIAEDGTPVFRNYIPEYNDGSASIRLQEVTVEIDGRVYHVTEVAPFTAATTRCFSHSQIDIWEGCKRIGRYAFYKSGNCEPVGEETWESLAQTVNLPSTLESIGEYAFDGMKRVRTINCMAVMPPALEDDRLFGTAEVRADITLNVPMGSVTAYETTPVWSDFKVVGVAGVAEASVDTTDGEAEYYNLQGIRVTPDAPGIYIRRSGDSVTKVLLRN